MWALRPPVHILVVRRSPLRMNSLKNFANLSMVSPCHCHLIFFSPVHHSHHHHHFHYASLHLCSTPDSRLTFFINPSHHSLPHLFGRISRIFMTISGLNCLSFFVFLFLSFLFDFCDRLIWFNQLLNCTLNPCTFLSLPLLTASSFNVTLVTVIRKQSISYSIDWVLE